jgi:hypothetical protein
MVSYCNLLALEDEYRTLFGKTEVHMEPRWVRKDSIGTSWPQRVFTAMTGAVRNYFEMNNVW